MYVITPSLRLSLSSIVNVKGYHFLVPLSYRCKDAFPVSSFIVTFALTGWYPPSSYLSSSHVYRWYEEKSILISEFVETSASSPWFIFSVICSVEAESFWEFWFLWLLQDTKKNKDNSNSIFFIFLVKTIKQ